MVGLEGLGFRVSLEAFFLPIIITVYVINASLLNKMLVWNKDSQIQQTQIKLQKQSWQKVKIWLEQFRFSIKVTFSIPEFFYDFLIIQHLDSKHFLQESLWEACCSFQLFISSWKMEKVLEMQAFLFLNLWKFSESCLKHYQDKPVIIHHRQHPRRPFQWERDLTGVLADNNLQSTGAQYFSSAIFSASYIDFFLSTISFIYHF